MKYNKKMVLMTSDQVNQLGTGSNCGKDVDEKRKVDFIEQSTQTENETDEEQVNDNQFDDKQVHLPDPPSEFVHKYFKSLTTGKVKKKKKKKKEKTILENTKGDSNQKWIILN